MSDIFVIFIMHKISPLKKYPHKYRSCYLLILVFYQNIIKALPLVSGILFIKQSLPIRFQKCNTPLGMTRKHSGI